jgi:hypothetical protein
MSDIVDDSDYYNEFHEAIALVDSLRTQLADATRKLEEVRMHTDAIDRVMLPDPQDERGVSYAWMKSEIRKRTASIRQAIEQGKGGDDA